MKKMLVRVVACILLFWAVAGLLLVGATRTFSTKEQAMARMVVTTAPSVYEVSHHGEGYTIGYTEQSGLGVAAALGPTGRVWLGFITSYGLLNSGARPWTNVTVTVTIQVIAISPNTKFHLRVGGYASSSDSSGTNSQEVSATGVYEIKSQPFAILPNNEYRGSCTLYLNVIDPINVQWVRVQVKSIKFDL